MPQYTFKEKPNGNIEVFKDGTRFSTGTVSNAERYGYVPRERASTQPPRDTNQSQRQSNARQSTTVLSNTNIIDNVIPELNNNLDRLSQNGAFFDEGGVRRFADGSPIEQNQIPTFNIYNPTTGQELEFAAQELTQPYLDNGWVAGVRDPLEKEQFGILQQLKEELDAATKRQIDSIEERYSVRKQQQRDIDSRIARGLGTNLLGGGSSRYAQESSAGIMKEEEARGMREIERLNAEEKSLINAAIQAQEAGNFEILEKQLQLVEDKRAQKQAEAELLASLVAEENEKLKERATQVSRESAISSVLQQGVTNTLDVLDLLNSEGGDFTLEEVDEFIDRAMPEKPKSGVSVAYEFDKGGVGQLLSMGFSGNDIQTMQDVFNTNGLYGKSEVLGGQAISDVLSGEQFGAVKNILYAPPRIDVSPGSSHADDSSFTTQYIRLGLGLFGSGRAFGEGDKQTAKDLVQSHIDSTGMSMDEFKTKGIYDLMDDAAGFIVTRNEGLGDGLRNTILGIDPQKGMYDYDVAGVARLINNKEDFKAVRKVEGMAMDRARQIAGNENFVSEDDVKYVADKVEDINNLLGQGWANEVGAFTGSFNKWISKKFGFGQSAKIRAKLTSITSDLINKRAGSALTETEWERLIAGSVPAFNESAKTWNVKLDELVDNPLERYNAERSLVDLPELTRSHIFFPESRTRLYSGSQDNELTDILSSIEEEESYNENFWDNAP